MDINDAIKKLKINNNNNNKFKHNLNNEFNLKDLKDLKAINVMPAIKHSTNSTRNLFDQTNIYSNTNANTKYKFDRSSSREVETYKLGYNKVEVGKVGNTKFINPVPINFSDYSKDLSSKNYKLEEKKEIKPFISFNSEFSKIPNNKSFFIDQSVKNSYLLYNSNYLKKKSHSKIPSN